MEIQKVDMATGKSLFDTEIGTRIVFKGVHTYPSKPVQLKTTNAGLMNRMEQMLFTQEKRIAQVQDAIAKCEVQIDNAKKILAQPREFPKTAELQSKQKRLDVLTSEIQAAAVQKAQEKRGKTKQTSLFDNAKMRRQANLEKKTGRTDNIREKNRKEQEQIG